MWTSSGVGAPSDSYREEGREEGKEEGEEEGVAVFSHLTTKCSPQEVQDIGGNGSRASDDQSYPPSQQRLQPLKDQLVPDGVAANNAPEEDGDEEAFSSGCHGHVWH